MRFDACVVMDMFPSGICLGPQELKCYNISRQKPTGEARIDERASLVVSFVIPAASHIPLPGQVDTGSGISILTFSTFNKLQYRLVPYLLPIELPCTPQTEKPLKRMEWWSVCASSWVATSCRPTS